MQTASLLRVDLGAQDPNTRGGIFDVVHSVLVQRLQVVMEVHLQLSKSIENSLSK